MYGGIFRRLLFTYIIIMVVIIGLLSIFLSQFLRIYFFQAKQRELTDIGRQVETQLIRHRREEISRRELTDRINTIGRAANARIMVVETDKDDASLLSSGLDNELQPLLNQVLEGEKVVERQHFARELNTFVVTVGIPVTGEDTKGAVLLFSPVYDVDQAMTRVYKIILGASLVSLAVGLVLIWITSRKMSRPITDLSLMARKIAEGEAVPDIPGEPEDEIGQLAHSFNYMKNQLAITEKMRQEFIAGVSHELRTPLTSIRGFIQGILDGVIRPEEQSSYLKLAYEETSRLTRLTNDLLELTKLEAGAVKLDKEPVVFRELLDESILSVQRSMGRMEFQPEIKISPPGLSFKADPDRLKQVMINLLTNAFKYTPDAGKITVEASGDSMKTVIRVIDTGMGIPADEIPFIFEKFHRVDKSRNSEAGGTGLGLSIVRNLVELHGGKITAESAEGKGTCFEIVLPGN
ncbi:MAG: hypothetical protein CVU89_01700 [Firmicutes bacterium HGW-Firmicutes-14]|nr:MAG: hypothetical protein CVU89_01700 [Firmicutes bacterium HGW-Firmicutes-14]